MALIRLDFPTKFSVWMKVLYSNLSTQDLCNNGLSFPVAVQKGLHQVDPLLPVLYNIVADVLICSLLITF